MQNLSYENKIDLHENESVGRTLDFSRRLVLMQRQKATRKWPAMGSHGFAY